MGPSFYNTLGSPSPINLMNTIDLQEKTAREQWPESFQAGNLGTDWVAMTGLAGQAGRPFINSIRGFAFARFPDGFRTAAHADIAGVDHEKTREIELFIFPHRCQWWGTYYLYFYLDDTTPGADALANGYPDDGIVAEITLNGNSGDFTCRVASYTGGALVASANGSGATGYAQAGWFSLRVTDGGVMELWFLGVLEASIAHGIPTPAGYSFGFAMKPYFPAWTSKLYLVGDCVVPTVSSGFFYQTFTGCLSGALEPTNWPTTIGATATDGFCTWVCQGSLTGARMQANLFRYQYDPLVYLTQSRTRLVVGCNGNLYVEADQFRRLGAGNVAPALYVSAAPTIAADRIVYSTKFYQNLFIADYGENKVNVSDGEITGYHGNKICSPTVLNFNGVPAFAAWPANTAVEEGDYCLPSTPNGYVYRCLATGATALAVEPVWPTVDGDTVVDNTTSWLCCAPRNVSPANDLLTIYAADSDQVLGQYQILYVNINRAPVWALNTVTALGTRVSALTNRSDIQFECIVAGTTAGAEPMWLNTIGSDMFDGTVTWRAVRSSFIQVHPEIGNAFAGENVSIQIERCPKILDFEPEATALVRANATAYYLFDVVRPARKNGLVFECTVAGTSAGAEPAMNVDVGDSVVDGGVTWVARKYLLRKYLATEGATPLGCKIITRYRGRICLIGNPANMGFGAFVGNPFDWDFGKPTSNTARAIELWPASAGDIPDEITAAIPASDDYLLIGTTDTLFRLAGDPANGGVLQNLSRSLGIISPTAWCFGPGGEIVFLSRAGIKISPAGGGGYPQDISELKLPDELKNIDPRSFDALMAYDAPDGVAHLYLSGKNPRATRHYCLDWFGNCLWPVDLHGDIYPRVLCVYSTGDAADSCVLHGTFGGQLLRYRRTYENDMGRTMSEFVDYGPFGLGGGPGLEGMVLSLDVTLDPESGPVQWNLFIAPTAEGCFDVETFANGLITPPLPEGYRYMTGTWQAWSNYTNHVNLAGCYAVLAITSLRDPNADYENTRGWAVSDITMKVEPRERRKLA